MEHLVGTLIALSLVYAPAVAQVPDSTLWVTGPGSNVLATARSGNMLYIGGNFGSVGPSTGGGVPVDPLSGTVQGPYARVAGGAGPAVSDGAGGWYVGGSFFGVGGEPRWNLAHVRADGSVDRWAPDPDGAVVCLAVSRSTIYVGGRFSRIAGESRNHIAAFDANTGRLSDWAPDASGVVWTILPHGDTIYVGGEFGIIGGQIRPCIAALDAATSHATAWNPRADGGVGALALYGRRLYAAGAFYNIGGRFCRFLSELGLDSDSATTWNPNVDQTPDNWLYPPGVADLKIAGDTLYVGGIFTTLGGQQRNALAAIDLRTHTVTAWAPQVTPFSTSQPAIIGSMQLRGTTLYACGVFQSIGGRVVNGGVGAVDTETGVATSWNPRPNGSVGFLGLSEDAIYVGGGFTSIGQEWVRRNGLASVDLTTGRVTSWDPHPDEAYVLSLATSGNTVYVAGSFSVLSGQSRANLAAFDVRDGNLTDWNPAPNGGINALAIQGNTVYVGGQFSAIGGQPRNYLAAIDSATGGATSWNPDPDDFVQAIAVSGKTVYAGGWFAHMRGYPQYRVIAAIDATTGEVRDWKGERDGVVDAIAVKDDTVYVGGLFDHMGGQPRRNLAAIHATTGLATPWSPTLGPGIGGDWADVRALGVQDNIVYVGGFFGSVNGVTRNYLAALDATTGEVVPDWNPNPDGFIWSMALGPETVYAGGGYERMNSVAVGSIAALRMPLGAPAPSPVPTRELLVAPNPASTSTTLRFALAAPAPVSLAVFDVQGRRMVTLLKNSRLAGGEHAIPLVTSAWPAGCYLARLESPGVATTRKMVVLGGR